MIKQSEATLGPSHPDILAEKGNYVITLIKLGKYKEVERIEMEMIESSKDAPGYEAIVKAAQEVLATLPT